MKIFTNRNLIQKLIIAIVCITLLNFCMAPRVLAADFGGKLMTYVRDFATVLGDVSITLIQFGLTGKWIYAVDIANSGEPTDSSAGYWKNKVEYPIIQISPELIFGNKVELLSIDFIGGTDGEDENQYILKTDGNAIGKLRQIIASWYVTLRTIAIVGLLSVLIYIGIRIIISSTSQDKAKYKQRLVDWIVAFCLLFFMHYIMAAAVNVIGKIDDILAKNLLGGINLQQEYGGMKYDNTRMGSTIVFRDVDPLYRTVLLEHLGELVYCVTIDGKDTTLVEAYNEKIPGTDQFYVDWDRDDIFITDQEKNTGIYTITYFGTQPNSAGKKSTLKITFTMGGIPSDPNTKQYVENVRFEVDNAEGANVQFYLDGGSHFDQSAQAYMDWYSSTTLLSSGKRAGTGTLSTAHGNAGTLQDFRIIR